MVDAGFYVWNVRIKIPSNLPPSFLDSVGTIQYWLYAYLDHDEHTHGICANSLSTRKERDS